MDDLIKRLRRAKLRHESGYMKDVGFLLAEAADALEAAREESDRWRDRYRAAIEAAREARNG